MAIQITETAMTSNRTRHSATVNSEQCGLCKLRAERGVETPAGGCPCQETAGDGGNAWSVTWLFGAKLTKNQAVTAMNIAESVNAALDPGDLSRVWPHVGNWAGELGLSDIEAVALASLSPEYHAAYGQPPVTTADAAVLEN